jgi:Flp pilus assembly protein TadG
MRSFTTRKRRGATLLEFAMVLPLILVLIMFAVDMGRMAMLSGALADATGVAARRAAQYGAAGNPTTGPARQAFDQQIVLVPGLSQGVDAAGTQAFTVEVTSTSGQICTVDKPYVRITGRADVRFITPGVYTMLSAFKGDGLMLRYTAVARCEVAY